VAQAAAEKSALHGCRVTKRALNCAVVHCIQPAFPRSKPDFTPKKG
jgi:hypothetical protein